MSGVKARVWPAVAGWVLSRRLLGRALAVCFLLVPAVFAGTTPPTVETRGACGWREGFTLSDLDGPALASAMFDDGSGPALYVAGQFRYANGIPVNGIARWDGSAWSPLSGPSGIGTTGSVRALSVFDDGSGPALYVGGDFLVAGGIAVNRVARWDGTAWSALGGPAGTGMDGIVDALTVFDDGSGPALFAGGGFSRAGGVWVSCVAKWTGSAWSPLAGPSDTGVDSAVRALVVFDDGSGPALYAGGHFTSAGGLPAGRIARWNGSAWSGLSGTPSQGFNDAVRALAVFDDGPGPALYAGGLFTALGSLTVNYVARWDGTGWSPLIGPSGTGTNGLASVFAVFNDGAGPALYAGGDFSIAGGVEVNRVARWDGGAWSSLTGPLGTGTGGSVRALSVFDHASGQALVVAGDFDTAGGVRTNSIAVWDGSDWSAFNTAPGMGLSDTVRALASFDDGFGPALYAGGDFGDAGGIPVRHVARWDGTAWSALEGPSATGTSDDVDALAVFDDGSGPALYAGGSFVAAGGVTANHLARWDGAAWTPLVTASGTGTDGDVYALAVFDDGSGPALYAGGTFVTAGGAAVNHVVRWNGAAWAALSGPSGTGTDGAVDALAVVDDGAGPALYAGGSFATAGGVTVNGVARWDGSFLVCTQRAGRHRGGWHQPDRLRPRGLRRRFRTRALCRRFVRGRRRRNGLVHRAVGRCGVVRGGSG